MRYICSYYSQGLIFSILSNYYYFLLPASSLIQLFSIFSSSLMNTPNSKFQLEFPHMLTDNLSEKGHLFLSSISIHPCKACLFISSSNTSQMLESPKKEAPLYQHQSTEMSNLLKTTSEFMSLSNRLTQCYVGCILQRVASFQWVNNTKSYGAHCLFPEIQKEK